MRAIRTVGVFLLLGVIGLLIWAVQAPGAPAPHPGALSTPRPQSPRPQSPRPTQIASKGCDNAPTPVIVSGGNCPPFGPTAVLTAVDATGPDDVWAVGSRTYKNHFSTHSYVLHWDGSLWHEVTIPEVGRVEDVSATAPDDVWILGELHVLHWDGRTWTDASAPKFGAGGYASIAATGPDDVWLGGVRPANRYAPHTIGYDTLVEHWDGVSWTKLSTPSPSPRLNYLEGIVALSPHDVWAFGYSQDAKNLDSALTIHWDGSGWTLVPSPDPGSSYNALWAGGTGGTEVWAAGHFGSANGPMTAYLARWNGVGWTMTTTPSFSNWSANGVSGTSSDDVWAIGSEGSSSLVIDHWDGRSWATVVAPEAQGQQAQGILADVTAISPTDAWAVGSFFNRGPHEPIPALIEHWDGSAWEVVAPPPLSP